MITLTIPNDDSIALYHFGKSLLGMAAAIEGAPQWVIITEEEYDKLKQSATVTTGGIIRVEEPEATPTNSSHDDFVPFPEVDTTAQQVESLGATHIITEQKLVGDPEPVGDGNFSQGYMATVEEIADPADKSGTPWDERIHSTSKALNADGTWRLRRKPKDMDELEWSDYVSMIKADLQYPVECGGEKEESPGGDSEKNEQNSNENNNITPAEIEPPVTPPGDDFHTDAGVVTEQTVAGIPPLPVPQLGGSSGHSSQSTPYKLVGSGDDLSSGSGTGIPPLPISPPVVVAPPVTEWDFPRLMTFLTERHGKIDVATVNTLLAQDGMSSVQELNAHPDKIGPFVARVKAHLGE